MHKDIWPVLVLISISCSTAPQKREDSISMTQSAPQRDLVIGQYKIEKGDTLMWIAYKIYGDVAMWRELQRMNTSIVPKELEINSFINYAVPDETFQWKSAGLPYKIMKGDTLSKISKKVYGATIYWQKIYKNNERMITNPNLIYEGFTLFYLSKDKMALY